MAYCKDYTESVRSQIAGLVSERLSWDDDKTYIVTSDEEDIGIESRCGLFTSAVLESVIPIAHAFGISYLIQDSIRGKLEIRIF